MPSLTPDEWSALALSLQVGAWSVCVGMPVAVAMAWVLART